MGDVQGPEKMNDTCRKTMHSGMMDRGFSVCVIWYILKYVNKLNRSKRKGDVKM
jgi:hypothetical protein